MKPYAVLASILASLPLTTAATIKLKTTFAGYHYESYICPSQQADGHFYAMACRDQAPVQEYYLDESIGSISYGDDPTEPKTRLLGIVTDTSQFPYLSFTGALEHTFFWIDEGNELSGILRGKRVTFYGGLNVAFPGDLFGIGATAEDISEFNVGTVVDLQPVVVKVEVV